MARLAACVFSVLLASSLPLLAVDGTFQGKVMNPPANQAGGPGWIYVQGRNHMMRRVEVSHADIVFADTIPLSQHRKCNIECLTAGEEIRVTAEQDKQGEWRAKRIEILKLTINRT
jgi:hypothetical protein